jgi:5-methylcytosine-specific restriction endonuclease McrA
MNNGFQYKADYKFFRDKLAGGDEKLFKRKYLRMFDFRLPLVKRKEFNLIRNKIFKELVSKHGKKCQLKIHPDCSKEKNFDVDHYIPLSTNKLNKDLRHLKSEPGKKVASQSFGSNDISNLRIACKRCNSFKKHRII